MERERQEEMERERKEKERKGKEKERKGKEKEREGGTWMMEIGEGNEMNEEQLLGVEVGHFKI